MEERGIISKYGDFGGGVWGGLEEIHVFGGVQVPVLHNRPRVAPNHPMGGRGGWWWWWEGAVGWTPPHLPSLWVLSAHPKSPHPNLMGVWGKMKGD